MALFDAPMERIVIYDRIQSSLTARVRTFSVQRNTTQCAVPTTLPIRMNALCTTTRASKRKQLKLPTKAYAVRPFQPSYLNRLFCTHFFNKEPLL